MKAKRGTRPTPTTQKGAPWKWREGPVHRRFDHFALQYGKAFAGMDTWVPVAIVGRARKGLVNVEFLIDTANTRNSKIVEEVMAELKFYFAELRERDPWRYLQYHCGTASNVYSLVHWSFVSPPSQGGNCEDKRSSCSHSGGVLRDGWSYRL